MPVTIEGEKFYRTAEVCRLTRVSKNTLFRWLDEGELGETEYRDWRGWRLFTAAQVDSIRKKTSRVSMVHHKSSAGRPS